MPEQAPAAGVSSSSSTPTQLDRILLELKELRREVQGQGAKIDDVIEAVRRGGGRKAEGGFSRQVTPLAPPNGGKSYSGLQGLEEAVRAQMPRRRIASSSESLFDEIAPEQLSAPPGGKPPIQSASSQQYPSSQPQMPQPSWTKIVPAPLLASSNYGASSMRLPNPNESELETSLKQAGPQQAPAELPKMVESRSNRVGPSHEPAELPKMVESRSNRVGPSHEPVNADSHLSLEARGQAKPEDCLRPSGHSTLHSPDVGPQGGERDGTVNAKTAGHPARSSPLASWQEAGEDACSPRAGGIRIIRRGDSAGNPDPEQGGGLGKTKQKGPSKVAWDPDLAEGEPNQKAKQRSGELPFPRVSSGLSIAKGSVDSIRKEVEKDIVQKNAKVRDRSGSTATHETSTFAKLLRAAAKRVATVNSWALRLGGVLPCSAEHAWASRMYQWGVLLLHTVIFAGMLRQTQVNLDTDNAAFSVVDSVLAGGCVAGLIAAGAITGSRQLAQTLHELECSNGDTGFSSDVHQLSAVDTVLSLVAWLIFLSDRLSSVHVLAPGGLRSLPWAEALRHAAVVVSSAQVFVLVLLVLRMSRNMSVSADAFCTRFCQGMTYREAAVEWNVLQAKVRMASNSIERCFAVLQSLLVLLALAMAFDIKPLQGLEWALTASGLLILGMSQILLRAAEVTDACVRIPQLVNAMDQSDDPIDQDRMYLVEYIHYSAAGFNVFNVRLGAGFAIKVLHYTGLLTFTLARLVLPSGTQP